MPSSPSATSADDPHAHCIIMKHNAAKKMKEKKGKVFNIINGLG
jgi:hypothetical protein